MSVAAQVPYDQQLCFQHKQVSLSVRDETCWRVYCTELATEEKTHSKATGSLYPTQWSQGVCKVVGVQNLYARVMVAVERRHCARTPSRDRVCWVGKPYPEVE